MYLHNSLKLSFLSFLGWIFHWTNDYERKGSPKTNSATLCSDHLLRPFARTSFCLGRHGHPNCSFFSSQQKTSSQWLEVMIPVPSFWEQKDAKKFRATCFFFVSAYQQKRITGRFGLLGNFLDGLLNLFRENSKFMDTTAANKFTGQLRLG